MRTRWIFKGWDSPEPLSELERTVETPLDRADVATSEEVDVHEERVELIERDPPSPSVA